MSGADMSAVNLVSPNWIPISEWKNTGRPWPRTEGEWRALLRRRNSNGLGEHVAKIGKTLLVNEDGFVRWISEHVKTGGAP
jgi:hypothetical protein